MHLLKRAFDLVQDGGLRGLFDGIRRFIFYRMPSSRPLLQLYYLARGRFLRKTNTGWCLYNLRTGEEFYFPQLRSHYLHTDTHTKFVEDTYFSGPGVEIEPGDVVFDVGAYVGVTSRIAARHAERVIAIEPSPQAHPSLEKNVSDYDNVEIAKCAVSDETSEMELQVGIDLTDNALIEPDDGSSGDSIVVPVKTITDLAKELNVSTIDFLKVEAEGLEPEVVRGAIDVPIKKIAVAGNDERYGKTTYQEVRELLSDAGFKINDDSEERPYNMVYGTKSC